MPLNTTMLSLLCTTFYMFLLLSVSTNAQGLKVGYYKATCPNVESIVQKEVAKVLSIAPSLSGPLLRMHFHDCFVRGCDASILLNSTMMNTVEKQAPPNKIVRGYGVIDTIKAKLEEKCPKTVSCADILALVARDVTYLNIPKEATITKSDPILSKGPRWEVPTGRRDGRMSVFSEFINLPPPFLNFTQLKGVFAQNGLSVKDLAVLSGSHTIGISQCSSFTDRLYNFTGKGITDPSLDSEYAAKLKIKCKPNDVSTVVEMDPGSFLTFDNSYYKLVAKRRGLFTSDKSLLDDPETRAYVFKQANSKNPYEFFNDFAMSMVKMGNIRVLTGFQGEIRKHCAFVN